MALDTLGGAGAGAGDFITELIARQFMQQLQAKQLQEQTRQFNERQGLQQRELDVRTASDEADRVLRGRQLDLMAQGLRDQSNRAGVADLLNQRELTEADENNRALDTMIGVMPEGSGRRVVELRRRGVTGVQSEDVETPQERTAREANDLKRIGQIAAIQRGPDRGRRTLQQVTGPNNEVSYVSIDLDTGQATPVQLPPGMAANKPPRAVTGAERQAVSFFNRMLDAERNARKVEDTLSGGDLAASEMAPSFMENWLKTPAGQQYTQAQRQWTEGRLRKESGAAIPPGEYDADRRTNFRTAADQSENVKQKRASRVSVLKGLGNSAGRALQEFYGQDATIESLLQEFAEQEGVTPQRRPIPGIPGAEAELQNGKWIRVK